MKAELKAMNTVERISDLEDRIMENTQSKQQIESQMKKNKKMAKGHEKIFNFTVVTKIQINE